MALRRKVLLTCTVGTLALMVAACGDAGGDAEESAETADGGALPDQMVWSTYPVGTTTYNDLAAVAEMFTSDTDHQVRIITSDTAIGRVSPLLTGPAQFARTGDEYIFAFEGDHDFASADYGPQPIRMVYPVEARQGFTTVGGTGVTSFDDLSGARVPAVQANPSINEKIAAVLAYADVSEDDVEYVEMTYSDQPGMLRDGRVDVIFYGLYGSPLFELAATHEVEVLDMVDTSDAAVNRLTEVAPAVSIGEFRDGPGMTDDEVNNVLKYPLPVVTTSEMSTEAVVEYVSLVVDNFASFSDTTPTTRDWAIDELPLVPTVVPYHDGLVTYLEDEGLWTPEAQEAQDELLEREAALAEQWDGYVEQSDEISPETWNAWKSETVAR